MTYLLACALPMVIIKVGLTRYSAFSAAKAM